MRKSLSHRLYIKIKTVSGILKNASEFPTQRQCVWNIRSQSSRQNKLSHSWLNLNWVNTAQVLFWEPSKQIHWNDITQLKTALYNSGTASLTSPLTVSPISNSWSRKWCQRCRSKHQTLEWGIKIPGTGDEHGLVSCQYLGVGLHWRSTANVKAKAWHGTLLKLWPAWISFSPGTSIKCSQYSNSTCDSFQAGEVLGNKVTLGCTTAPHSPGVFVHTSGILQFSRPNDDHLS